MEEIRTELGQTLQEYHACAAAQPAHVAAPLSKRVRELQMELSDALSEGAKLCPDCGHKPKGMRHIHVVVATQRKVFTFEVGCGVCPQVPDPEREGFVYMHRSQGGTREEAVENWNAGVYLPPKKR
jgi:hypothetical protein